MHVTKWHDFIQQTIRQGVSEVTKQGLWLPKAGILAEDMRRNVYVSWKDQNDLLCVRAKAAGAGDDSHRTEHRGLEGYYDIANFWVSLACCTEGGMLVPSCPANLDQR